MFDAALLAFVAGCADVLAYLHFHTFAGFMNGNTVFLALQLFGGHPARAAIYAGVIAAFCAGTLLARLASRLGVTPRLALTAPILIFVLGNFGHARWTAAALAVAMGVQNTATKGVAGVSVNTTFITGDLQKLMDDIVARLFPIAARKRAAPREPATVSLVWTGYVAGAVLGAAADRWLALPFLVPVGLLLLFVLCANMTESAQS